jgi:hypothetical protein
MAAGKSGKRSSLAELGPAWITAIATLVGSLVAVAGFFALRAATVPASSPEPAGNSARVIGNTPTRSMPVQPASPAVTPGSTLTQFNVDLPGGYGLTFGASPTRPVRIDSGAELFLRWSNGFYTPDQHGTLATLDASTPTYADCVASTRFTSSVIFPKPGTAFCYLGHDLVVGIKVVKSLFGQYDTLAITVWQAPPA